MLLPGRSYLSPFGGAGGGYRYGFNGKENDNEVKGEGNQQDYGFRIYDGRLGRFLSVDPLTKEYPELTSYQFASNRPIDGIDRDGLEFWVPDWFVNLVVGPFIDFGHGGAGYYEGTVQKTTAQTDNTSYQNEHVPKDVQHRLAQNDIKEGTTKQIKGATKMGVASAEATFTYVPLTTEIGLAIKAPRLTSKPVARWILKKPPKPTKGIDFLNRGSETLDDAIRMKDQPFEAAKTGTNLLEPLGLGSTGRTVANNLTEKLAMKEIISNPRLGTVVMEGMKDSRWLGWSKMQYVHRGMDGSKTTIHYVGKWENGVLKAVDDFKFK